MIHYKNIKFLLLSKRLQAVSFAHKMSFHPCSKINLLYILFIVLYCSIALGMSLYSSLIWLIYSSASSPKIFFIIYKQNFRSRDISFTVDTPARCNNDRSLGKSSISIHKSVSKGRRRNAKADALRDAF